MSQIGGFDTDLRYGEDHDLWLRLLAAGYGIAFVDEILAEFRVHQSNQSQDGNFVHSQGGLNPVFEKFFERQTATSDDSQMRDAVHAMAYLRESCFSFARGDAQLAVDQLKRALALDPSLGRDNGRPALDIVLGFAHGYCIEDPLPYTRLVLANLPEQPFAVRGYRRKLMGRAAAGAFFRAARWEDWHAVPAAFVTILRYDWSWLRNRGVWSILARSLMTLLTQHANRVVHAVQRFIGQSHQ